MVRGISRYDDVIKRKSKEITNLSNIEEVHIDGFNTIITLEVALSNSLIIKSMDETIRDLAGLRGTYSVIEKTEVAIKLILEGLEFQIEVWNIDNVDSVLKSKENVVSSDAIILDNCISWINLNMHIIKDKIANDNCIDFNKL